MLENAPTPKQMGTTNLGADSWAGKHWHR